MNKTENLNKKQLEAVNYNKGPLLILAGAGTGKTKVLTNKIAYLINNNLATPQQILAVTFTNKAAKEMIIRVEKIIGSSLPSMYIGTFHSIAAKILRNNAHLVGLNNNFNIVDSDDQLRLIRRICNDLKFCSDDINPKFALNQISLAKDKAQKTLEVNNFAHNADSIEKLAKIFTIYNEELIRANSCDFGDLILHNINILANKENTQKYYNNKFKYILVDEYQDTNISQYLWLRLLAQGHSNICCVGDDDQSIYGFRGAEVKNILRFEKDFKGSKVIKLEQNYRSTKHILNAASNLINTNKTRHGKTLFTDRVDGHKIKVISSWDENGESQNILREIETLKIGGANLADVAILVRAFYQTRNIEERLINEAVPYKIVGGLRFYDRKEIKDIIAYLRVINSDSDSLALERVLNVPKRALGPASFAKLNNYSAQNNLPIFVALQDMLEKGLLSGNNKNNFDEFANIILTSRERLKKVSLKDLAKFIIEKSGYEKMLDNTKDINTDAKKENLREFCNALSEYDDLNSFLEHVSLVSVLQENNQEDSIYILTLHSAKGLEFETVFLTGWEEGVFPHQKSIEESGDKGLEEERRLAYVGITRAKTRLFITYANNRRIFNKWQTSLPSRFLKELPKESIDEQSNKKTTPSSFNYNYNYKPIKKIEAKFKVNDNVKHSSFGDGVVKSIIGDVAEVNFSNGKCRFVTSSSLS